MNCVIQLGVDIRNLKSFVVGKASLGLTIAVPAAMRFLGELMRWSGHVELEDESNVFWNLEIDDCNSYDRSFCE